jgi:hypothetical protein
MAKVTDLMGLGMPVFLAERLSLEPAQVTAVGATRASSTTLGGHPYMAVVVGTNSGVGTQLPNVGGDQKPLLGDGVMVHALYATASVYPGSGATISAGGALYTTATSVPVEMNTTAIFYPATTTQWIGLLGA